MGLEHLPDGRQVVLRVKSVAAFYDSVVEDESEWVYYVTIK